MTTLVTGGAGFIGSHLCERLLTEGHKVVIVDELNDFYAPELKRANLNALKPAEQVSFYQNDICDEGAMLDIFQRHQPDTIVHLAARAGVRPSLEEPLLYERVNVRGTMVLLEAARRTGTKKFVFASSSSIYGATAQVPFAEDDAGAQPISPYAATKIAGEKICYTYSHLYQLSISALRFFTVYGPRQRPDLAIRKFTEMIDEGCPIPVFGDGSAGRDYTYVEDTVDGIRASMDYRAPFEVFNLGNSHPISLSTMIETIEKALGKKAKIQRRPDQPGDVPITYASIAKAQQLLGYNPRVSFEEGIQRFVQWHSKNGGRLLSL